jgi:acyl-CoA synthetase (AMP-forming)/AMP-acid ligase II
MHPGTHGSPLLAWLHDPSAERGIHFAQPDGSWSFCSYRRLAEMARAAAAGLVGQGVRGDDVVALVGRSTPELVATFFGALLAGATPSPMAPPAAYQGRDAYAGHTRGVLRGTRPALVVADAELLEELVTIVAGVSRLACFDSLRGDGEVRAAPAGRRAPSASRARRWRPTWLPSAAGWRGPRKRPSRRGSRSTTTWAWWGG